jgi:hypothetical protein
MRRNQLAFRLTCIREFLAPLTMARKNSPSFTSIPLMMPQILLYSVDKALTVYDRKSVCAEIGFHFRPQTRSYLFRM